MKEYDLTKTDVLQAYQEQKEAGAYNSIFEQYVDPGTKYAFYILENKVLSSYKIKLACFRHLQDLLRQDTNDFPYHYDLDKVRSVIGFASLTPDVTTGKPVPLMLWQKFILALMFGWRDSSNNKRYTHVITSVSRTNGKTYISNIISAYAFLVEAEGLYNQDLAYIAPVTQQASKGFSYLKTTFNYLSEIPQIATIFKQQEIAVLDDRIISRKTQNKLLRLTHESGKLDSYHFLQVTSDEAGDNQRIGKIKDNNNKITSGQVQTKNSQFLSISTAYSDSTSFLYNDENMIKEAMEKDAERTLDDYLVLVWEQDTLKETEDPTTWIKSNPLLELPEKHDSMLQHLISERDTALETGELRSFQNKNLNLWLQEKENRFLELEDIESNVIPDEPISLDGREVYAGFDKSSVSDNTSLALIFPYVDREGSNKFYVKTFSWIPLARSQNNINIKEKEDGIPYSSLDNAFITKNEHGFIDDQVVFRFILDYIEEHQLKVKMFCYDKWSMSMIIQWLDQQTDLKLMPIQQDIRYLTQPTLDFRRAMEEHQLTYTNDKILVTAMKNAVTYSNNNGMKVDKEKGTAKIDTLDALINAFVMARYEYTGIDPEPDSKKPFGNMTNDQINDYFTNDFSF